MKTVKSNIGDMVKQIIKSKGLKLAHVADAATISLSHLNKIMSGEKNPSIEVIRSLAKVFDVKESDLIGDEKAAQIEQKIGDMTKSEFETYFFELLKKAGLIKKPQ
jgi:transcriptional regulator with XRE-family HTH domain